jgi:hypothetical protein
MPGWRVQLRSPHRVPPHSRCLFQTGGPGLLQCLQECRPLPYLPLTHRCVRAWAGQQQATGAGLGGLAAPVTDNSNRLPQATALSRALVATACSAGYTASAAGGASRGAGATPAGLTASSQSAIYRYVGSSCTAASEAVSIACAL